MILGGSGTVRIGDEEAAVRAGHVVSRPAGTALAHSFRAGPDGLEYLAYGQRHTERHHATTPTPARSSSGASA